MTTAGSWCCAGSSKMPCRSSASRPGAQGRGCPGRGEAAPPGSARWEWRVVGEQHRRYPLGELELDVGGEHAWEHTRADGLLCGGGWADLEWGPHLPASALVDLQLLLGAHDRGEAPLFDERGLSEVSSPSSAADRLPQPRGGGRARRKREELLKTTELDLERVTQMVEGPRGKLKAQHRPDRRRGAT